MIRDGSLERYYNITEWVACGDSPATPINLSIFTNNNSIAINKDPVTVDFELTSWGQLVNMKVYGLYSGYDLVVALIAVLQHSIGLINRDEIKDKIRESIEFLKDNVEEIDKLIRSIKIAIPTVKNYVEKLKAEAEEDRKLWEKLRVTEIATEEEENTMVSPASVYLSEGEIYSSKGDIGLIEKIRKNGELVKVLRVHNSFNARDYVDIYKCSGEYYAIRTYEFDNLQGYTCRKTILYKIEEGFID